MACVDIPDVPSPPGLGALTIPIQPLPSFDVGVNYCCRLQLTVNPNDYLELLFGPIAAALILVPPEDIVVAMQVIRTNIAIVNAYKDALPLDCPLE